MQNLRPVRLAQRAQTSSVISLYRHLCDVPLFGRQAMLFRIRSKGLATKTKFSTNRASDSQNSDPSEEDPKTKGESPNSSPATVGIKKEHKEYYSLKMHREGPNSESGELNPDSESKQVKGHNKATANRYEKR